uniref:Uncharacterized protein n=1 Tax=Brassica campestris TaxID=3711 RepID=A0A3P5YFF6_BRACM|nr:unnamed protein product [Brassica rapa]
MSKEGLARGIGPFKPVAGRAWAEDPTSRNVAGLAGIDLRGMGSVRDGPKKTAVNPNVPQLLLSSFDRPPEEKKRESESESGVATARDGAPAMVSSSMMLPVYPSPSISSSEASWKHNKKFAKELSIEEEDHQLRSWFLHRRCSCALLRYMHGKNGAYTVVALDSISVTACLNSIQFVLVFVFSL